VTTARRTRTDERPPAAKAADAKPKAAKAVPAPRMQTRETMMLDIGAWGSMALGVPLGLFGVIWLANGAIPMLLALVATLAGVAMVPLGLGVRRHSRAAWAFLSALDGVGSVCLFFGATVLAGKTGWPLVVAGLPSLVLLGLTVCLALGKDDVE
jgi:hypothetical protein